MGHLEESFMLFMLPIADRSLRRQTINPKKLHIIDWSLTQPFLTAPSANLGHKLETAIYLHWRRQRDDLGYLAGEREVDLVLNLDTPELLVNSCLSLASNATWQRETAALQSRGRQFPDAECLLVAHDTAGRKPSANIKLVEAWRYLLA
jgi:predicted AAA+ superfamily ATPase